MIFYIILCILLLENFSLNEITASGMKSSLSAREKLNNLVQYNVARQRNPKTLRLISYHTKMSSNLELAFLSENQVPLIIGNNKPLEVSLDPRTISTGRMVGFHEKFKYVVLILIDHQKYLKELMDNVKKTVNRRFDRVLVLTNKDELLSRIMFHETTQDLLVKFGMSLESEEIWVDPLVHDKGNMLKIKTVEEIQEKKKMGGNLHGRHLKVAGTEFPPVMYKTGDSDDIYSYNGTQVNIVRLGSEKFNYTYEFSYDWHYGQLWPNGTWTGMYSRVFYPEKGYHFTIALSTEYIWNYGVDMATIIDPLDFMFATNQPQTKLEWYAFLLPFSPTLWTCIIITYVILAIVQFTVMYIIHDRKLKYIVWDSAIYLPFAMATEQGLCDIPKGARYLSLIWLLGCLVLGTGYKSTLRNNLSFPTPETIPMSFEELGNRPDYGVTLFYSGEAEKSIIEGSSIQSMVNIRHRMKYSDNLDTCLRDVYQTPHTVCISWSCLLFYQTARSLTVQSQVSPLVFSRNTPKVNILSMAFQKDSIFVDSYSRLTESVFETGIIDKWKAEEDYKSKKAGIKRLSAEKDTSLYKLLLKQTKIQDSDRHPLKMRNLWAVFSILPLGVVVGMLLLGIEHFIFSEVHFRKLRTQAYKLPILFSKLRNAINNLFIRSPIVLWRHSSRVDPKFGRYY